jgi:hypothetical protein
MSFRVGIGSTHIASFSANGVPYLWQTGDVTTLPSVVGIITASDGAANHYFGNSVAVGCGRIVVGATGNDINGSLSGSAYIFDLDGNEVGIITASDGDIDDYFGGGVSIANGRIVISATGNDINGPSSGSVYIFDLDGNEVGIITASNGGQSDLFGVGLAVGCGKIVVGAPYYGLDGGIAYIYNLDGTGEIILNNASIDDFSIYNYDYFGFDVAVGNGRIVIGAWGVELPGGGGSSSIQDGMAYIFDLNGHYIARIDAGSTTNASDDPDFGYSVAVGCGRIVIGARDEDSTTSVSNSGAVYIYDLNGVLIKRVEQYDPSTNDRFGHRVAVGCGRIVVSTILDNSSRGAVYVFDLDGNFLEKITASDAAASDYFGSDVSIANGRIVIGAYFNDINGSNSGSAYIYKTPDVITAYDVADWNSY